MLQAKDCAFDVQVMAPRRSAVMRFTVIRFYKDIYLYDHVTGD